MNLHLRIPVHANKVVQRILHVIPAAAAPRCAPVVANQCLPTASITALESVKPCPRWLAAPQSARVPVASRTSTSLRIKLCKESCTLSGLEVLRPSAAVSTVGDLRASRSGPGALDDG